MSSWHNQVSNNVPFRLFHFYAHLYLDFSNPKYRIIHNIIFYFEFNPKNYKNMHIMNAEMLVMYS